jgi:WXG100 family type VII secretion target
VTQYQVDSEAVRGATGAVRGSMGRIQGEVSGLYSQLVNLQSSWSGQAAASFQSVLTEWKATQQRVEENLASLNQALVQAAQQYEEIEQSNARLFSR